MTISHDVSENILKQKSSGMLLGKHLNLPMVQPTLVVCWELCGIEGISHRHSQQPS
jgi:hypothetical protein